MTRHPSFCNLIRLLLLFFFILPGSHGYGASPGDVRLGGQLKSLNLYLEAPPTHDNEAGMVSANSLRLELSLPTTTTTSLNMALETRLLYADPRRGLTSSDSSPNRRLDLEHYWNKGHWFNQQLLLDRLNLQGNHFGLDWCLGRQAIGFGRISLFSPLDIIAPFPPDALDTDIRPGVDALRASHYFGMAGQVSAAMVLGRTQKQNSYVLYGENNWAGIDVLAITGRLRRRPMIGLGFATQLAGMGVKGEAVRYEGQGTGRVDGDLHEHFTIAGVELDYRFDNGLILFVQYLYNGAGVDHPDQYGRAAASAPLQEGLSYLLGRHYLLLAPSYEIHPLVTVNGLWLWNLRDHSYLFRPLLHISLSDNWALDLFWNITQGKKPAERDPAVPIPVSSSEFGATSNSGGLLLKYYF